MNQYSTIVDETRRNRYDNEVVIENIDVIQSIDNKSSFVILMHHARVHLLNIRYACTLLPARRTPVILFYYSDHVSPYGGGKGKGQTFYLIIYGY